jgi:hypothetical protein
MKESEEEKRGSGGIGNNEKKEAKRKRKKNERVRRKGNLCRCSCGNQQRPIVECYRLGLQHAVKKRVTVTVVAA